MIFQLNKSEKKRKEQSSMKYTQKQVKKALEEITRRTRELLNSEEGMTEMSFDERISESITLTSFEQDIRFLLNEPWQELEKEIRYLETLLKDGKNVDLNEQLKELKRQKSKRSTYEEEGMLAYEKFQSYKNSAGF